MNYSLLSEPSLFVEIAISKEKSAFYFPQKIREKQRKSFKSAQLYAKKFSYSEILNYFSCEPTNFNKRLQKIIKQKLLNNQPIPREFRKEIWLQLSNVKYLMKDNPKYYEKLVHYKNYPNYFESMIEKDVYRTINSHIFGFNKEEHHDKLKNLLSAYSIRNNQLGYCQGFNYITSYFLILEFSEEVGYLLYLIFPIVNLLIIQLDYYSNLYGVLCDIKILQVLIQLKLPQLKEKLEELNIDATLFSSQWFVCLFTHNINKKISELVMDNLLSMGYITLLKVAITYLHLMEEDLLKCHDISTFLKVLQQYQTSFDNQHAFQTILNTIYIHKRALMISKDLYLSKENDQQQFQEGKFLSRLTRHFQEIFTLTCDPKSPLCIYSQERQRFSKKYFDQFSIRIGKKPEVINDYWINKLFKEQPAYVDELMIGRDNHCCVHQEIQFSDPTQAVIQLSKAPSSSSQISQKQNNFARKPRGLTKNKTISHSPFKDFLLFPIEFLSKQQRLKTPNKKLSSEIKEIQEIKDSKTNITSLQTIENCQFNILSLNQLNYSAINQDLMHYLYQKQKYLNKIEIGSNSNQKE